MLKTLFKSAQMRFQIGFKPIYFEKIPPLWGRGISASTREGNPPMCLREISVRGNSPLCGGGEFPPL